MYSKNRYLEINILFIFSLIFVVGILIYSNKIFGEVARNEREKVDLFAQALKSIGSPEETELNLYWRILEQNKAIPILVFSEGGKLIDSKNIQIDVEDEALPKDELVKKLNFTNPPIVINIGKNMIQYIYYSNSPMLTLVSFAPFVQILSMFLIAVFGYIIYANYKKREQEQLLYSLSRETAHQLATPITSLLGWLELIEAKGEFPYANEMRRDVGRLKIIMDRFDAVGKKTILKKHDVVVLVEEVINYMKLRIYSKISIELSKPKKPLFAMVDGDLFGWVIENLIRNSVDAITKGEGEILFTIKKKKDKIVIDCKDTGKGIEGRNKNRVFNPGYTTKKRGWGIGLSLVERIVKDFSNGEISVLASEKDKGTIMRIWLPLQNDEIATIDKT